MKKNLQKIFLSIVCLLVSLFCITACGKSKVEFKVNFVVDGEIYATLNTSGEEIIKMPENPTKDDYDFDGWYWDKDTWQTPFTANSLLDAPLSSDLNVYCKWKPKTVHVSGISLNKSEISLRIDETEILMATITPANATDTSVLWESSNATIATVTSGKITALRVGSATITATANDGGEIATCQVTVYPIPVESVSLNESKITLHEGNVFTLTATISPANATNTDVTWKSSDAAVAKVVNGKITAVGSGIATITVTTNDGGKTATCAVEVIKDTITFKTMQVAADGETVYGKVSNATTTFSFLKEIEEQGNATYQVYKEITCETLIASKSISLNVGDNTVYVLQTVGKNLKLYTVTVRRRPIYNVSFDTNGGSSVQSQQVEEDSFATVPITRRAGYTFTRWTYDFSKAITKNTEIKAVWKINQYTLTLIYGNGQPDKIITQDYNSIIEAVSDPEERAGYDFIGWNETIPETMPAENITITAKWNEIFYRCWNSGEMITGLTDYGKNKYTELIIPAEIDGVKITFIGSSAFSGCSGLTSVTIGNSVTSIGDYAFYCCSGLTSITIPDSVKSIGDYAFSDCSGLMNVTIPGSVTSIGESAFHGCCGLTSVTIPGSVTSIGDYAFYGCSGLTSITIPDSVTSIGDSAFDSCGGLAGVYITDLEKWCKISFKSYTANPLFYAHNLYLNNELITDLVIPSSVTSIGDYAFV